MTEDEHLCILGNIIDDEIKNRSISISGASSSQRMKVRIDENDEQVS